MNLKDLSQHIALSYRLGREGKGSEDLVRFVDALSGLVAELDASQMERLNCLFAQIFAAQQRRDFVFVADILEYELPEILPCPFESDPS